ncbi:MAG: AAA family ATPase [Candidatus Lokiarchaeota archaeon]|nr:AAA family ATPase [Candidatus Lokiarchaeota archaeon]
MLLKNIPLIVAIAGKGGVGKTIVTTLIAKTISTSFKHKLLLIDADPTHPHLSKMVKLVPEKSLEKIRADLIDDTISKKEDIELLAENIDFKVYNAIKESKDYSLFSIGQPEGPGCFCPSNALLRKVIESISSDFDVVLIDCEAGLEQINRMVISSVDILIVITDISLRSVETAKSISESAKKFTNYKRIGVIVNRAKGDVTNILKKLEEYELPVLTLIPEDELLTKFDLDGKPIIDVPETSISFQKIKENINEILKL